MGLLGSSAHPAEATIGGHLVSSSPGNGSRSASAPSQVRLEFSLLPLLRSWVTVSGPSGVVASGPPFLVGHTAYQSLPGYLPDGDYAVRYYADFGLFGSTSGTVFFAVGPAPVPSTSTAPNPSTARRTGAPSATAQPAPATTPAARRRTTYPDPSTTASPAAGPGGPGSPSAGPTAPDGTLSAATGPAVALPDRSTDLTALAGPQPVAGSDPRSASDGWPLPPPLVLLGLLLAATAFAVDRWWTTHRDRAQLRRAATGSPAMP